MRSTLLLSCALLLAGAPTLAQANADPAIDIFLGEIDDLTPLGRVGVFPNGSNGCALQATACNAGTQPIDWMAVMDPDHPFIAFLVARESQGRFQQISDRSFVKHAFFALPGTFCGTCAATDGTTLGVGCSDTYLSGTNGDNFWLGPAEEIDPWLGTWDPICSHFDRGEPPVPPPQDCNGVRSLSLTQANMLGNIGHRMRVRDEALDVPGASFWFQAYYVVAKEPEAARGDSLGSRAFAPAWNGTRWEMNPGGPLLHGTVLQRWQGADLDSATNGADDGRLYVAVKVTGPVEGLYHYEYAFHNRDNARGVGAVRIPVCPQARVSGAGFSDVDPDPTNDWSPTRTADELVFANPANPLGWNTIYNVWFDSDAAPGSAAVLLDQASAGAGQPAVAVSSRAPTELRIVHLGPGCALGTPPSLHATGSPAAATLGNASFALRSTGNAPLEPNLLLYARTPGSFAFAPCTVWLGADPRAVVAGSTVLSDAGGTAVHPMPVPNDLALEGRSVSVQLLGRVPGGGVLFRNFELSEAVLVRVGSSIPGCP